MYQPNEPIRGKYLVRMEAKIAEDIAAREARRAMQEESCTRVDGIVAVAASRLRQARTSFFASKTDRSVSSEIVAIQPSFLG